MEINLPKQLRNTKISFSFRTMKEATISICAIYILEAMVYAGGSKDWTGPRPEVGYPAGLVPNCPGVMNNTTISLNTLRKLMIVHYVISKDGQVQRRMMRITMAAKIIGKDKSIDLKAKKTLIYTTGFLGSFIYPHNQAIAAEYARRGYNVFMSETIAFLTEIYPKSARMVKPLGVKIGEFLVNLYIHGLNPDNIEMVGVSLGAHVLSHAAKHFFAVTGKKPFKLTGLDPAGPCFRNLSPELRFSSNDAEKVDAIHTNIDGFGMADYVGHVDFYVNGGEYQPSDIPYIPCLVLCSHLRSTLYWWQALQHPKKFIGIKCDTVQDARFANCYNNSETNFVGLETNFDKPGIYYLSTNNEFPYFEGKRALDSKNEIYTSIARKINMEEFLVF